MSGASPPCLLALTVFLRLPAFFVDVFNSDETFLATQAQVIRDGGDLYREAADRKPPLVPYIYAATFAVTGTTALWSVRVLAMLAVGAHRAAARVRGRGDATAAARCGSPGCSPSSRWWRSRPRTGRPRTSRSSCCRRWSRRCCSRDAGAARRPASRSRSRRSRSRPAPRRCSRSSTSLWKRRGRRGVADARRRFALPLALVALVVRPGQLFYWTVLGNGSYVGVRDRVAASCCDVRAHDARLGRRATCPILWTLPRSWRRRRDVARRRRHRTPTCGSGSLSARDLGGGRAAVLRSLLPAARPAARAAHRGRALARSPRRVAVAHGACSRVVRGRCSRPRATS